MNKEDLKKIKVLYYPYKAVKRIITGIIYYVQYTISLFFISKNKKRVDKKIDNNEVLNVVFVVQYIPGWNKLEPIYSKMQKDQRFNPIIVCVPLNIQNHILLDDNGNDTYKYFIEHGYKAIDALLDDGSWFDLKQLKPDYLFHSRPYNAFMPRCYTSDRIVRYALICNVLYGASVTTDMRAVTLNNEYFRDVFCFFASDVSEKIYYEKRFRMGCSCEIQKCYPFGAIGLEQMLKSKSIQKNNTFCKTVIWTPRWSTDPKIGGSNFFNYKDFILSFAKKNEDILFVFRPHPLMFGHFIKTGEMAVSEVKEFKKICEQEHKLILDESKEYSDTFWNSDILISDVSSIVTEYFITQKPIIYCHSHINYEYSEPSKAMIESCYEAFNEHDLEKALVNLLNNVDEKRNDRKEIITKYFDGVEKSSANIVYILAKGRDSLQ